MVTVDLNPGPVADNFLNALLNCSKKTLLQLTKQNYLRTDENFPVLSNRSICYEGLEAYVRASNLPLCYFFFGTDVPPVTHYTPFDNYVIAQINKMSVPELQTIKAAMYLFFPNPIFDLEETDYRHRTIALMLHRLPREKIPEQVEIEPYKNLDATIIQEYLVRYGKKHFGWVKLDTANEIATFLGVSLHWILNLKTTNLFCSHFLGDQIFSYYTLLPIQQRGQFLQFLWQCTNVDFVNDYMKSMGGGAYGF